MAKQLFSNRASSLLAASISGVSPTITVATGDGALFPSPTVGDYILLTLEDATGATEVVKITARTGDSFTYATVSGTTGGRGQEGTAAASWAQNLTRVELRATKGTMETFVQRGGDSMDGDLDMQGNDIVDAHLTGTGTKVLAGEIVNVPLRGLTGATGNQLTVPVDGTSRAQVGGLEIATRADLLAALPVRTIIMWYGTLGSKPAGWEECNGTLYGAIQSPDLRNKWPMGASAGFPLTTVGGGVGGTSGSESGTHIHTATGTAISTAQMPAHTHGLWGSSTVSGPDNELSLNSVDAVTTAITANSIAAGTFGFYTTAGGGQQIIENTGAGATHTHTIGTNSAGHTHTTPYFDPAFVAVYFLIRVS